ncbi:MAG TPA: hypothetical protein DCE76_04475, partial [Anaerolineaceae bacterium]|nr:hypothetical protein [Anaerolineaceae bacterium]
MNIPSELNILWFIQAIKRRLSLIAGLLLLVIIVVVVVSQITPPSYRSSTTLLIMPSSEDTASQFNTLLAGERLALTYSQIITSRPILEKVINQNSLNLSIRDLEEKITVEPIRDTQLIRISVTDSSPVQAQVLANSIATSFVEYVINLTRHY